MAESRTTPRFSILTPAYNASATIARAIESVLAQTEGDWEHVIVDDGSTDSTLDRARHYASEDPRIKVFACAHRGVTLSRIEAMHRATGQLFARLDADDEMEPVYLEKVDEVFRSHPDAQIVSTNGYQVHADGTRVYYYTDPVFQALTSLTLADMLDGHLIGTSGVMTREVYELTGGPRPEARSEDVDLWLRSVAMGAKHYHLPEPVFLYHQDAENRVSSDVPAVWRSHVEILEHLLGTGLLSERERQLARAAIRRYRIRLALRWDRWGSPARRSWTRRGRS